MMFADKHPVWRDAGRVSADVLRDIIRLATRRQSIIFVMAWRSALFREAAARRYFTGLMRISDERGGRRLGATLAFGEMARPYR